MAFERQDAHDIEMLITNMQLKISYNRPVTPEDILRFTAELEEIANKQLQKENRQ